MNTFVILFHCRAPLAAADRDRLNQETASWAAIHNTPERMLDPRILASGRAIRGPDAAALNSVVLTVSALLFLEAADLGAALGVAESHPGLRYGFTVEVRPCSKPGGAPSQPANSRS